MTGYHTSLMTLLTGVLGILIVASGVSFILSRKMGKDDPLIQNLSARINAWWVMAAVLGLSFWWGRSGVVVLFAICSFAALREFVTLTNARRADTWMLAALFYIALPLQYWAVWTDWYGFASIFIPVYVFLGMPILSALRGETDNFLIRVAEVQWAAMIAIYCVSHIPALLSLSIPGFEGKNILLIAFLVIVVQASDVLQYVWGKLKGKRKIAPRLSPSKTVEGFVGGVGSATLLGAFLFWLTPFNFLQAGAMALVIALMGFFGGLVLSAVKRDRGVKDWGATIAGHGGFIDRLDSLIFAAPIFFPSNAVLVGGVIARLAGMAGVHVAVAFVLMGSWALYANWAHPMPKPMLAGLVQGALSGSITYALKRTLDGLRGGMGRGIGWWLPPVIACTGSLVLLVIAHLLAGTPEVLRTISIPFCVATLYAVTYNLIMWKSESAQ